MVYLKNTVREAKHSEPVTIGNEFWRLTLQLTFQGGRGGAF